MKPILLWTAAAVVSLGLAGCDSPDTAPSETTTVAEETMPPPIDPMAADTMMVGGAEMFPTKTIVENAMASPIHTTLVTAVKQAGLADTLSGPGPFTVFAPTNDAFEKVPAATLNNLMAPGQKDALADVLKYHVVAGNVTAADLATRIKAGGGKAMLTTVQGDELTATMAGDTIMLTGANGSTATITQSDVMQSNGVIHVVDGVLTPKM